MSNRRYEMTWRLLMLPVLIWCGAVVPVLRAQTMEEITVRQVVAAVASLQEANDIAGLDTLFAPNPWVEIIEGSGVNHGWTDYRMTVTVNALLLRPPRHAQAGGR